MKLKGKLSISFLQVIVVGRPLHSKHFIVAPNFGSHPFTALYSQKKFSRFARKANLLVLLHFVVKSPRVF